MREWKPLLAGSIPIPGVSPIPVYWTSPDLHGFLLRKYADGTRNSAFFDSRNWQICLCAGMPIADYPDALLHETQHAIYWASSHRPAMFWHYEHQAVKRLTPGLLEAVSAMGWKPLPIPVGHSSLQRHARAVLKARGF